MLNYIEFFFMPVLTCLTTIGETYFLNTKTWCERVIVPEGIDAPECRDPSDISFLELALAGRADALVTGDGDLLALAPIFAVPIITPSELRQLIADSI